MIFLPVARDAHGALPAHGEGRDTIPVSRPSAASPGQPPEAALATIAARVAAVDGGEARAQASAPPSPMRGRTSMPVYRASGIRAASSTASSLLSQSTR